MKPNSQQKGIDLFDLIAIESTSQARELLKKMSGEDALNKRDLKAKLAKLYFNPNTDKLTLEKELANIHPHKDWILKRCVQETKVAPDPVLIEETSSNADGQCSEGCKCRKKCGCCNKSYSNFDSDTQVQTPSKETESDQIARQHPILTAFPTIALVGIFCIAFYAISSVNK